MYFAGLFLLGAAVVMIPVMRHYVLPMLADIPSSCALFTFLGVYCPGCGGTRSVDALLHGHILQSFWYHPLVLYCVVLYMGYMITWTFARLRLFGWKKGMKFRAGYLYGMLAVVAVNFIIKNVLKFCFGIVML